MNISPIVGFSRLTTTSILFTQIHTDKNSIPRDLKLWTHPGFYQGRHILDLGGSGEYHLSFAAKLLHPLG